MPVMLQFLVSILSGLNPGFMLLCCRDALSDLAIHFLDKIKVMVVKDIEREDIEFITKVRCEVYKITTPTVLTMVLGVFIVVQKSVFCYGTQR